MSQRVVAMTVDLEPDCPPFLRGFRGVEHGLPRLLELLAAAGVRATFYTTGEVATKYPDAVRRLVSEGHELGCHGMTHTSFADMTRDQAAHEIDESARILRDFAPLRGFRAPYLTLPAAYVPLVEAAGFDHDSSQARYKWAYYASRPATRLRRIPASLTSSALRLPRWLRESYLAALSTPVVLFVHPWEFVDLRREKLRWDCRVRTGDAALQCLDDVLRWFGARDARFVTMSNVPVSGD